MNRIFITGATGNVGLEVIRALTELKTDCHVIAGVKDLEASALVLKPFNVGLHNFDFTDPKTFEPAFSETDILFLLRPPQISEVNRYFKPLIKAVKAKGIKHIVFLSVQGVQKSSIIPHYKIEKLIVDSGISYTFLRPAYFMQNFLGNLHKDLVENRKIFLPAGDFKFNLVDVKDIGNVAAKILVSPSQHLNMCYDLTSKDRLSFAQMARLISAGLHRPIDYEPTSLFRFFITKYKEKMPVSLIFVMMMLHYLPRFQDELPITDWVEKIAGNQPISFEEFIIQNRKGLS